SDPPRPPFGARGIPFGWVKLGAQNSKRASRSPITQPLGRPLEPSRATMPPANPVGFPAAQALALVSNRSSSPGRLPEQQTRSACSVENLASSKNHHIEGQRSEDGFATLRPVGSGAGSHLPAGLDSVPQKSAGGLSVMRSWRR